MLRQRLRLLGGVAVAVAAIVASAGAASAHVSVNPDTATQGGFTKLSFRVPNEQEDVTTTKVQVAFPTQQPLGFVSVKPHPGWSYAVTKAKLARPVTTDDGQVTEAVATITWTADSSADAIKPGEFDEFDVSVGPLPEATSMQFKALQTYSDGEVVRWIEPVAADGTEPEHPAPTLQLTPAAAAAAAGTTATTDATSTPAAADSSDASQTSVNTALVLAIVALLVDLPPARWEPSRCADASRCRLLIRKRSPGCDKRGRPNGLARSVARARGMPKVEPSCWRHG